MNYLTVIVKRVTDTVYFDELVQDWSNFIANALELLQSYTKPSIDRLTPWGRIDEMRYEFVSYCIFPNSCYNKEVWLYWYVFGKLQRPFLQTYISQTSTEYRAWIPNYIQIKGWGVNTNPR